MIQMTPLCSLHSIKPSCSSFDSTSLSHLSFDKTLMMIFERGPANNPIPDICARAILQNMIHFMNPILDVADRNADMGLLCPNRKTGTFAISQSPSRFTSSNNCQYLPDRKLRCLVVHRCPLVRIIQFDRSPPR